MPTTNRGVFRWLFKGAAVLEDFADRLSHVWTTGFLLVLAAIISWKQEVHQPISCFTPSEFTSAMNRYAHEVCWGSYYNHELELKSEKTAITYKWIPIILVIQAILFKLPHIVMNVLHGYSGISFEKIAGFTEGFKHLNLSERSQLGQQIGQYLYFWCRQWGCFIPWRGMTIAWMIVKLPFCINATVQMSLVDSFLSTRNPPFDNSTSYGDVIYENLFDRRGDTWKISPAFPRVVMCDFSLMQLQDIARFKIQCALPINEFNEYVYMLVWLWLLVVAIVSWLSFVVWLGLTLLPFPRQRYVTKMMNLAGDPKSQAMRACADKLTRLIGQDGVSVLKLVSANSSELLVRDAVWSMFIMSQKQTTDPHAPTGIQAPPYEYQPVMTNAPTALEVVGASVQQPEDTANGAEKVSLVP